jgi:hypothetical protein
MIIITVVEAIKLVGPHECLTIGRCWRYPERGRRERHGQGRGRASLRYPIQLFRSCPIIHDANIVYRESGAFDAPAISRQMPAYRSR